MNLKSIRSVAETYFKMRSENSDENLAATDAAQAQKDQEPMQQMPDWVPGDLPDDKKKEFVEAVKKAYESDNTQFDFDGRTYKITEKELVGDQDKLDVDGDGKIDADDLAKLRGEKPVSEDAEKEVETPGQEAEMPEGESVGDGDGDEDDIEDAGDDDKDLEESVRAKKAFDMQRVVHGAMSRDEYKKKWANIKSKPKNPADRAVKEDTIKEGEEEKYKRYGNNPMASQYRDDARRSNRSPSHQAAYDAAMQAHRAAAHNRTPEKHLAAADAWDKAAKEAAKDHNWDEADNHRGGAESHRKDAEKLKKAASGVKEGTENPTDTLTIDVPAMIRALEKSREDFKTDADIHNFVQNLLKKKDQTVQTNDLPDEPVKEALDPKADAGVWIKDFQDSDDPKFAGKSQDERKQQALAAWYAARRDAGIKESTQIVENVAGDARATDLTTKANQASALAHSTPAEAGALQDHDAAAQAHQHAADHYRVYAHHAGDPVLKSVADIHHKFHSDMAHYHTMRGVNLSMNEGAPADAKGGPEIMDPVTKKAKEDADKNVKAEEAPYTNKADGSEDVVPAEKPAPNPTSIPTLKKENTMTDSKSIKSVAEAYVKMTTETSATSENNEIAEQIETLDEASVADTYLKAQGNRKSTHMMRTSKAEDDTKIANSRKTPEAAAKAHYNAATSHAHAYNAHREQTHKYQDSDPKAAEMHHKVSMHHYDAAVSHLKKSGTSPEEFANTHAGKYFGSHRAEHPAYGGQKHDEKDTPASKKIRTAARRADSKKLNAFAQAHHDAHGEHLYGFKYSDGVDLRKRSMGDRKGAIPGLGSHYDPADHGHK